MLAKAIAVRTVSLRHKRLSVLYSYLIVTEICVYIYNIVFRQ